MTDSELLREYVQTHSDQAFGELVRRHIDWVSSAALRQTGNRQLADDVTQAAFIALAIKARSLCSDRPLEPWLFQVTRHAAANAMRSETRRKRHEQRAAAMTPESSSVLTEAEWEQLAPVLDELVDKLRSQDRLAVLLRFYQGKSFEDVGKAMGITEEAARKRADRAVDKLREKFAERGFSAAPTALAAALAASITRPADAALTATTTTSAMAAAHATAVAGHALAIAKGAMWTMAWAKAKLTIAAGVALLFLGTGATVVTRHLMAQVPQQPAASQRSAPPALAAAPASARTYRALPVMVEQSDVFSGFCVGIEEKQLNQTVDALAATAAEGTAEKALGHLVHAIVDNNQKEFAADNDLDADAPLAAQLLTMTRTLITDAGKVQVVRSFAVGGATVFVAKSSDHPDTPIVFLFASRNGRQVCSGKDFSHPVVQNLSRLAREMESHADAYAAKTEPTGYPLSLTFDRLFGDDGRHPVVVCFNGYPLNYAVGPASAPGASGRDLSRLPADYAAAVRVYDEAVANLARGDTQGYAATLGGDQSRKWFADHIANKDRLRMMVSNHSCPRVIRYILGSPSIKILVLQTGPMGGNTLDTLDLSVTNRYVQIVTPPGGKAAIVNIGQLGSIDSLLTWPEFGDALVKKYINAPGQEPQKRQ